MIPDRCKACKHYPFRRSCVCCCYTYLMKALCRFLAPPPLAFPTCSAPPSRRPLIAQVDDRPNMRPGAKYFEWEAKGVPLRVELGPRDAKAGVAVVVKRTGGERGPRGRGKGQEGGVIETFVLSCSVMNRITSKYK